MPNFRSEEINNLFKAMLSFDDTEQFYSFFEDVCTITELKDMAQRFEVARMLDDGMNYQKIADKTKVSTATISRVSRCLNYGNGGYKMAIDKLKETEE